MTPLKHSLYHTDAVGASGDITLPVTDRFPIQASLSSGVGEGTARVRIENFRHHDYLSIGSMETHVVSVFSQLTGKHSTRCSVIIEDLRILNVLRCDRIVMNLAASHPKDVPEGNGTFALHGTHFENFAIGGHKIDLTLEPALLQDTKWSDFLTAFKEDTSKYPDVKDKVTLDPALLNDQAAYGKQYHPFHGVYSLALAKLPATLPAGLSKTPSGHGIVVPHFGKIYPAHYYVAKGSRRVSMLHVELGCAVEGKGDFATGGANGMPIPGGG